MRSDSIVTHIIILGLYTCNPFMSDLLRQMEKDRPILVTGGAGFIGSHLCDRLIQDGHEVICLDNLYTGSIENIHHLIPYKRFHFVNHNVIDPFCVDGIKAIFNLACPASPVHYQKDPVYTTRTSVIGILNMLELAKLNGCPILQASTSEVYGDAEQHPQKEGYHGNVNPIGIRSCYDEGKRCAESLCMDYYREYGVKVKIVRIFNTYGPRMLPNDGRVVSNFIVQALKGEDLFIYGNGEQTRSFQYVNDLVEAFIRFIHTEDEITGPLNIGNPQEVTVKQLASAVISLTCSNSKMVYCPLPSDDPHRRRPDVSLACSTLGGWHAQTNLETGLLNTIAYFRNRI